MQSWCFKGGRLVQMIIPHLWFDKEAKEAASFYIGIFEDSKIIAESIIKDTPSGDSEFISFELAGQPFMAISAGPFFRFNPSVSLIVECYSKDEVDNKWEKLTKGGKELIPLGEYPFSDYYAWVQDKYGLTWQLMYKGIHEREQKITPNFLFSNEVNGKAEEAVKFYTDIFNDSEIRAISKYNKGEAPSKKALVNYASFILESINFVAMDNGYDVDYTFNEAFSFLIQCKNQDEIDYFWDKLSAIPEAEECGWLKDKFGLSWQIIPEEMNDVMLNGTDIEKKRVTEAFLKMKKIDLEIIKKSSVRS